MCSSLFVVACWLSFVVCGVQLVVFVVCCSLVVCCVLFDGCWSFVFWCMLLVVCCLCGCLLCVVRGVLFGVLFAVCCYLFFVRVSIRCQLFVVWYSMCIAGCLLFVVCRLSCAVCFCRFACLCAVAWSLLVVVYYWFGFVLGGSLFVGVCCLLFAGRSLLQDVCCCVFTVC